MGDKRGGGPDPRGPATTVTSGYSAMPGGISWGDGGQWTAGTFRDRWLRTFIFPVVETEGTHDRHDSGKDSVGRGTRGTRLRARVKFYIPTGAQSRTTSGGCVQLGTGGDMTE